MDDKRYAFILISDEKYWNRLCKQNMDGKEIHAFVRKSHVGPLKTEKLLFYIKRPIMQVRGFADFVEREAGNSEELWNKYGAETCLKSFNEYVSFIQGREIVTFVRFKNLKELENPTPSDALTKVLGVSKMPRGGKYINRETANQLTV